MPTLFRAAHRAQRSRASAVLERRAGTSVATRRTPSALCREASRASCARRATSSVVPMLREGEAIGVDRVSRRRAGCASRDQQIELCSDLRRPGGDRDRERAPVQRDARRRSSGRPRRPRSCKRHRQLADRRAAGVRRDRRKAPRASVRRATTARLFASTANVRLSCVAHAGQPRRSDAARCSAARRRACRTRRRGRGASVTGRSRHVPDAPRADCERVAGSDARRLAQRSVTRADAAATATRSASIVDLAARGEAVHRRRRSTCCRPSPTRR